MGMAAIMSRILRKLFLQPTNPSNKPPTVTNDDSALRLVLRWVALAKLGRNSCKQTGKFGQKWVNQERVYRIWDTCKQIRH